MKAHLLHFLQMITLWNAWLIFLISRTEYPLQEIKKTWIWMEQISWFHILTMSNHWQRT